MLDVKFWSFRDQTTERLEPEDFAHPCIATWPQIPPKFTRDSHLESAIAPNRLFKGSDAPPVWVRFPSPAPLFVVWRVPALS